MMRRSIYGHLSKQLEASGYFQILQGYVEAPIFFKRADAVATLARMGHRESVGFLSEVFEERRDTDPFLMPGLVSEIRWLDRNTAAHDGRLGMLAGSSEAICRWAAVEIAGDMPSPGSTPAVIRDLISGLEDDPFSCVREQAKYLEARFELCRKIDALTKEERISMKQELSREKKRVESSRPDMTFSDLYIRFWNAHEAPDYTCDDIYEFLDKHRTSESVKNGFA